MWDLAIFDSYRIAQNFGSGKSDEFDEWMLNCQNFPYQNFALKNTAMIY